MSRPVWVMDVVNELFDQRPLVQLVRSDDISDWKNRTANIIVKHIPVECSIWKKWRTGLTAFFNRKEVK